MAKHTPAPWRVEHGTTLVWGACDADDNTTRGMGYPIIECRTSPSSTWQLAKGPDPDEGEANARLIAAAPDLLSALKWFIDDSDGTHTSMVEFSNAVASARAAIAKAEGN